MKKPAGMSLRDWAIQCAEIARMSEVARVASDIKKEVGCTRTEALAAAEKLVPQHNTWERK